MNGTTANRPTFLDLEKGNSPIASKIFQTHLIVDLHEKIDEVCYLRF
jgi:hypothetical protein